MKREGGLTWGAGPVLSLPTDTDPTLGSGKWGLGPTGLALVSTAKWTYGALVNHVWGIADTGDVERADLSTTFLQPFLARHLRGAVTATIQSESTYNWEADSGEEWTVPINVIVSKVTKLGPFPFSVAGGVAPYCASKAGLIHLTRAMALELARHGIRVNALAPGYVQTELNRDFLASAAGERLMARIPQRRFGRLDDLDGPLLLLACDAGAFMTGSVLAVDGGHLVSTL